MSGVTQGLLTGGAPGLRRQSAVDSTKSTPVQHLGWSPYRRNCEWSLTSKRAGTSQPVSS